MTKIAVRFLSAKQSNAPRSVLTGPVAGGLPEVVRPLAVILAVAWRLKSGQMPPYAQLRALLEEYLVTDCQGKADYRYDWI
jgi:hypothetical protein